MFRLYGYLGKLTLLDISPNEADNIENIDNNISLNDVIYFQIIKHENDTDEFYRAIHNFDDYINYLEDYRNRQKTKMRRR